MNIFQLVGRVATNPETQITQAGTPLTKFALRVPRDYVAEGKEQEYDYPDLTAFGKMAEAAGQLARGDYVSMSGRITTRTWKNGEGEDRKGTDFIVERLRKLGGKAGSTAKPSPPPKPKPESEPAAEEEDPFADE